MLNTKTDAQTKLLDIAQTATTHIPPYWPLTATVAVNPYMGQADEPLAMAAARLARVGGGPVTQARSVYARMIANGVISDSDLAGALAAAPEGLKVSMAELKAAASRDAPAPTALPTVADLAADTSGTDWPAIIDDRIGLWAAGHFDTGQALWPAPDMAPFAAWRGYAKADLTPEIAGLKGFASYVAKTSACHHAALAGACETLGIDHASAPTAFHRLLMSLGGWAQLARGIDWEAARDGSHDTQTAQVLAVRLIWEAALLDQYEADIGQAWETVRTAHAAPVVPSVEQTIDAVLQEAAERAAQRGLADRLAASSPSPRPERPALQAAFCIDVRSEVFRRALEALDDHIETIGFAGFFGLAVKHKCMASDTVEARAPVLLSPGIESQSSADDALEMATRLRRRAVRAWGRFKLAAVSSFAFVEAAGPVYAGKLLRDALGHGEALEAEPAPVPNLQLPARAEAAASILQAMSLTGPFARVVLIVGHGAHVANAPHASALQCGACGGHSGDVNARLVAALLNDAQVRAVLKDRGVDVPEDTHFVAGLHDTISDRVTLYEDAAAPDHRADLARIRGWLDDAGRLARAERAQRLPRAKDAETLVARGQNWAETRPEWGLAGCNAFIAAPRHRTAGCDLEGRAFLHSYDWQRDTGFAVLELILTAPVVVASWISLQYYASSVAPDAFGAGNKLLHNVAGGIGVVEGNGGALRAGLPWQSVHDGTRLRHEPLRLSVIVEAPAEAILEILGKYDDVKALFDNGWLKLFAMDEHGALALRYEKGAFIANAMASAKAAA